MITPIGHKSHLISALQTTKNTFFQYRRLRDLYGALQIRLFFNNFITIVVFDLPTKGNTRYRYPFRLFFEPNNHDDYEIE